jgi:PAS domain S-box-containing protein
MPAQSIVPIRDSIAKQLLKVVFALYFVVTVTVTLTQMSAVYLQQKESVEEGLVVIQHTFEGVLSSALWKLDSDQVNSALMGVMKSPSIIGIKILSQHGDIVAQSGVVTDGEGNQVRVGTGGATDSEGRVTGMFWHSFPLEYMFLGNTEVQGEATVYSSSEVVFKRVQLGFAFIIVNSIIKTVAIWFLFLWAFRRFLGRPLMTVSASIERLNLESLEDQPEDGQDLDLKITEKNELMVLEITFNNMTRRLREGVASRRELQQAAVQQRNQFYTTLRSIGDGVITTDKKGYVTFINPVAQTLTGWNFEEAVGRQLMNVYTIINEETRQAVENSVAKVLTDSVIGLVNHTILISKNKKEIPIDVSGAPIKDEKGGITGIVLVFRDNTERKQAEEKVIASLKEKQTLLDEIHHRVKNNMNIISSLLKLQSNNIEDEHTKNILKESQNRIYAMSAIHETIHGSENLSEINLKTYLYKITDSIFQSSSINPKKVKLKNDITEIPISINQASPIGLVTNELISNSLKYAFPDGREGEISVAMNMLDKELQLTIKDNGVGMPKDFDWKNTKSLGLKLVCTLVENQLDGSIDMESKNGTKFTIKFNIET